MDQCAVLITKGVQVRQKTTTYEGIVTENLVYLLLDLLCTRSSVYFVDKTDIEMFKNLP